MTVQPYRPIAAPAPGWYPDPYNRRGCVRWWDGATWTGYVEAVTPPVPQVIVYQPAPGRHYVSGTTNGSNMMHLVLTLCTCGLWLPVWLIVEWLGRRRIH